MQFCLFTVNIKTYYGYQYEKLFQTFGDAFGFIEQEANGSDIIEIGSHSFCVEYIYIDHKNPYSYRFNTATIYAHLFTYDETKPLIKDNFMWKAKDDRIKGRLQ